MAKTHHVDQLSLSSLFEMQPWENPIILPHHQHLHHCHGHHPEELIKVPRAYDILLGVVQTREGSLLPRPPAVLFSESPLPNVLELTVQVCARCISGVCGPSHWRYCDILFRSPLYLAQPCTIQRRILIKTQVEPNPNSSSSMKPQNGHYWEIP